MERLDRLKDLGRVFFRGAKKFGPELFQHFADADVLVVPSRSEGTPRVAIEARAFGCPVIGTNVGGIPTSITDGVDGLLVPVDNPQALCDAMLRVAREPELRQRLIAGGIDRARRTTMECFAAAFAHEVAAAAAAR
jgi:glycosyltransferase involved in cell wall biosynthesis